jgi:hypothetical protein
MPTSNKLKTNPAREAYLIFALHPENRSRHVLGDQATSSDRPDPLSKFNRLLKAPLPFFVNHRWNVFCYTSPTIIYHPRSTRIRTRIHISHRQSQKQKHPSGLIVSFDLLARHLHNAHLDFEDNPTYSRSNGGWVERAFDSEDRSDY